jgi:hypothetical protein
MNEDLDFRDLPLALMWLMDPVDTKAAKGNMPSFIQCPLQRG